MTAFAIEEIVEATDDRVAYWSSTNHRGEGPANPMRLATRGQCRELAIAFTRFGLADRAQALGYCACVVGRPIESRKTLTTREASKVLDLLEKQLSQRSST